MQNGPAVSLDGRQPRERTAPAMERTSAAPATAAADAGCVPETAADTPRGQEVYLNVRPPPHTPTQSAREYAPMAWSLLTRLTHARNVELVGCAFS